MRSSVQAVSKGGRRKGTCFVAIPDFVNGVLPPWVGTAIDDPTTKHSPYPASLKDFMRRFGNTPERRRILRGLNKYRALLKHHKLEGVQWLAGSFVECKEDGERRCAPADIDVLSILWLPDRTAPPIEVQTELGHRKDQIHEEWLCDAHTMYPRRQLEASMRSAYFWASLFGHSRDYNQCRKGIVVVELRPGADPTVEDVLGEEIE